MPPTKAKNAKQQFKMVKEIPQIGKGKKMSIAKAGLIVFYEERDKEIYEEFDVGVPDLLHKIVEVAGANHSSFFTPRQVMARLRSSPYFQKRTEYGMYKGIRGTWKTTLVKPSPKGEEYYPLKLKNRGETNRKK